MSIIFIILIIIGVAEHPRDLGSGTSKVRGQIQAQADCLRYLLPLIAGLNVSLPYTTTFCLARALPRSKHLCTSTYFAELDDSMPFTELSLPLPIANALLSS
jgi:hypothetical protein